MDTTRIIEELIEERNRIDEVIRVLSGSDAKTPKTAPKGRKPLSLAARKRMAEGQRKRWAKARKSA